MRRNSCDYHDHPTSTCGNSAARDYDHNKRTAADYHHDRGAAASNHNDSTTSTRYDYHESATTATNHGSAR